MATKSQGWPGQAKRTFFAPCEEGRAAQWGGLRLDKQGRCPCTPAKAEGLCNPIAAGAFRELATFGWKGW